MNPLAKSNSSTLPKDRQELHKRTQKSLGETMNSWKYSSSEQKIWKSMRQMQLTLKKPTNTGRQTMTKDLLTGTKRSEGYEENEGYISDIFISVTDSDHTINVLAPYIKHNGLYCLGTAGIGEPVYRQELFTPQCITVDEEGEFPHWFFELLSSNSTYTAMANYLQTQKDWGIAAEFQPYHDTHTNTTTLVTEHQSLATTIEALQQQLEQSQQCLLSFHAYKWYQLFHTLHEGLYIDPKSKGKGKFTSIPNSSHCSAA